MQLLSPLGAAGSEFAAREARFLPTLRRLAGILGEDRQTAYLARAFAAYERYPAGERQKIMDLLHGMLAAISTPADDMAGKATTCIAYLDRCRPYADVINLCDIVFPISQLLPRLNRDTELPHYLQLGADAALAFGDTTAACQCLGALGTFHGHEGDAVRMTACWDEALRLARACHSWQEARILSFFSAHYRAHGDPGRAVALLAQAEERCRDLGAEESEIRFLHMRLALFADLACWDLVERDLRRADVLLRTGARHWRGNEGVYWTGQIQAIRMKLDTAQGNRSAALRAARRVAALAARRPVGPDRARLQFAVVRSLGACGAIAEARDLLARVVVECERFGIPELLPDLHLEAGRLDLEQGIDPAAALARFRGTGWADSGATESWIQYHALAARGAEFRGDHAEALREVDAGLTWLGRRCTELGDSPEGGLVLARFRGLRESFQSLAAETPKAGYAFELAWSALQFAGHTSTRAQAPAAVTRDLLAGVTPTLSHVPPGTRHAVYAWSTRQVVRWLRDGDRVTRTVISTDAAGLRAEVERAATLLEAAGPGEDAREPLSGMLAALARVLLPAAGDGRTDHRRLLITRDGPLARLPFEALRVGDNGGHPLLLDCDVAYVDAFAAPGGTGPAPADEIPRAMVVTAPLYPGESARRWSVLNEGLPAGANEAAQFARLTRPADFLYGAAASRESVIERWERAPAIYLATHVVRGVDLSYEQEIPLAGPAADSAAIDMRTVRRANLSRCRLVVLSGCATGTRYDAAGAELPGLGDLFAGAGAAAVVQTGWNVRDEDGATLMHAFNERWAAAPDDPVGALSEARRDLLQRGGAPRAWAAYTVLLTPDAPASSAEGMVATAWTRTR